MRDNGIRRAAVLTTSAWSGYSSCTQYVEDIARARRAAGPDAPELVKLRHLLRPSAFCRDVRRAPSRRPPAPCPATRDWCSPRIRSRWSPTALRSQAVQPPSRLCHKACRAAAGTPITISAWQSRSGPPQVPWLEPDVADHLTTLAASGTKAVIVCPIGFVADHIEVVWDLDHELRSQAEAAGIAFARAATPNADRRFARLAADLIDELRYGKSPDRVTGPDPVPGCLASINGAPCRPPHRAAGKAD